MKNLHVIGKELFITSDEEIKKDDYYLGDDNHIYCLCTTVNSNGKKIILTTNADYIEEGIQAIDDEFLEWFVKNPSCEEVEVKSYRLHFGSTLYKVIIPQEESKQADWKFEISSGYNGYRNKITDDWIYEAEYLKIFNEPKPETFKEAAENYLRKWRALNNIHLSNIIHAESCKNDFIAGAKSDAAKDYWFEIFKKEYIDTLNGN